MEEIILKARLKRLEQKADEAKANAERAFIKDPKSALHIFWDGVETSYRTAIQIMLGSEDTIALMIPQNSL